MFNKKVLSVFVLSLMLVGLFSFVVSAQSDSQPTPQPTPQPTSVSGSQDGVLATIFETIFGGLGDSIGFDSNLTDNFFAEGGPFTTVLLFLLVALIIYSLGNFMPFIQDKNWVSFMIAIVVALLSTIYLNKDEITTILFSYKALGIVLTGILPFFAIAVVSKRSYEKGHLFISKFLWVAFIIVILMRFVTGINTTVESDKISQFGKMTYSLLIIAASVMFLWERVLYKLIFKSKVKGEVDSMSLTGLSRAEAELARVQGQLSALSEEGLTGSDAYNNLLKVEQSILKKLKK